MQETKAAPTIGRVVHYRLPERYEGDERWRPATVVNAFPGSSHANLTVQLDPSNDREDRDALRGHGVTFTLDEDGNPSLAHVYSADEGTAAGCWRWPPRV